MRSCNEIYERTKLIEMDLYCSCTQPFSYLINNYYIPAKINNNACTYSTSVMLKEATSLFSKCIYTHFALILNNSHASCEHLCKKQRHTP